jgi:hypothetical protein
LVPHVEHGLVVQVKTTGRFVYRHTAYGITDGLLPNRFTVMRTANRRIRRCAKRLAAPSTQVVLLAVFVSIPHDTRTVAMRTLGHAAFAFLITLLPYLLYPLNGLVLLFIRQPFHQFNQYSELVFHCLSLPPVSLSCQFASVLCSTF